MHAVLLLITSRHSGGVASNVVFVLFMVSTQALYGMSECVSGAVLYSLILTSCNVCRNHTTSSYCNIRAMSVTPFTAVC